MSAAPVEFGFSVEADGRNPFSRLVSAEVVLPDKSVVNLPAFYAGDNVFAVRARAEQKGLYRLGALTEEIDGVTVVLKGKPVGPKKIRVRERARPAIVINPRDSRAFAFTSGERFVPLGMNLAWADERGVEFYHDAFPKLAQAGLNWARVWMASWDGMNLDWLPKDLGPSPLDGTLDLRVAANWDRVLNWAEENGVYVQLVLQHHGQYSSRVNPNWNENPWNEANGGFLKNAAEFFTSPRALALSRQKYRYIVARWGYSPAIMAWELFNEVHWVDAMREKEGDPASVVRWHEQMAAWIRSVDRYRHLVTTSTENLNNPLYSVLDYYQPHLYAPDLLAGSRHFLVPPADLAKPIFYGEVGDDHLPLSEDEKRSGVALVPPVWAGLMGPGSIAPQPWLGWDLLRPERLREMSALARFFKEVEARSQPGLQAFSAVVETQDQVPFVLLGGFLWQPRPSPDIAVPLDGREPEAFGSVPRIYMNQKESAENHYSSHSLYRLELARDTRLKLTLTTSPAGGGIRVSVDGAAVCEETWPEPQPPAVPTALHREFSVTVPAGRHTVAIENPVSWGWFDLEKLEADAQVPVLAAIGRRNDEFVMAWLWNRRGVYSKQDVPAAAGTLLLDDLPPGVWTATWWDSYGGTKQAPQKLIHKGGMLRLPTPPISHHAALMLERTKS